MGPETVAGGITSNKSVIEVLGWVSNRLNALTLGHSTDMRWHEIGSNRRDEECVKIASGCFSGIDYCLLARLCVFTYPDTPIVCLPDLLRLSHESCPILSIIRGLHLVKYYQEVGKVDVNCLWVQRKHCSCMASYGIDISEHWPLYRQTRVSSYII